MKWYVSGDTSEIAYLPDLPEKAKTYDYTILLKLNIGENVVYTVYNSDKPFFRRGEQYYSMINNEVCSMFMYIYIPTEEDFILFSELIGTSTSDLYNLGYNYGVWCGEDSSSNYGAFTDLGEVFYSNYDVLNTDGSIYQSAGKIYNGDWEIFGYTGLPPIPDDVKQKYPYIEMTYDSNNKAFSLWCSDKKCVDSYKVVKVSEDYPFYQYEECYINGDFVQSLYYFVDGLTDWNVVYEDSSKSFSNSSSNLTYGMYPYWASYEIPVYENGTQTDTVYQQYGEDGTIYATYPYSGTGGGGTEPDEPDNPGGGDTPDNPTEVPSTHSAFMMGYMVGKSLRLSR